MHKHFTTGQPCNCKFDKHLAQVPDWEVLDPERVGSAVPWTKMTIGDVDAVINVDEPSKTVEIFEWKSKNPGQGNTTASLNELRRRYPGYRIHAPDSYSVPGAAEYWDHMKSKGLIDSHGLDNEWELA